MKFSEWKDENDKTLETLEPFNADSFSIIGFRILPKIGKAVLYLDLLCKENNEHLYTQFLIDIESKDDLKKLMMSPINLDKLPEDIKENGVKKLMTKMTPGKTSFVLKPVFVKELINLITNKQTFRIEGFFASKESSIELVKPIKFTKPNWIKLSMILFQFLRFGFFSLQGMQDPRFSNVQDFNISGMLYDGCTDFGNVNNKQSAKLAAHFTLYLEKNAYISSMGINIIVDPLEGKIPVSYISKDKYTMLYGNDSIITPTNIFDVTIPDVRKCVLAESSDSSKLYLFMMTEEIAERIHWLDWGHYIYVLNNNKSILEV